MAPTQRKKGKLAPKRHHWWAVLLFILGTLFPPLAVAARFGVGADFWLNLLLTICGYIPGHGHNFYIQNIRNNKTKARTPKWAARYGLVDTTTLERHAKRSQWAARYNERNPNSTLEGQAYEEGQERVNGPDDLGADRPARREGEGETNLWNPSDESFYSEDRSNSRDRASALEGGTGRWHYPANFDDALPPKKVKKSKKDRWARTEDAYNAPAASSRSKRRKSRSDANSLRSDSTTDVPEDPEDGLYGSPQPQRSSNKYPGGDNRDASRTPPGRRVTGGDDEFSHQF